MIIILNDENIEETTDENYKNYVVLLETIKELFIFTSGKNYLSRCKIWKIDKNPIDFNIFKKYKTYKNYTLQYNIFGYLSEDEQNNMIQDDHFIYHDTYKENELITQLTLSQLKNQTY